MKLDIYLKICSIYIFATLFSCKREDFSNEKNDLKSKSLYVYYSFTDSKSTTDRYSYQIFIKNNTLNCKFISYNTDSYNSINYDKSIIVNSKEIDKLIRLINQSHLTIKKNELPYKIEGSAKTTEKVIVHTDHIKVTGVLEYSNEVSYPDSMSNLEMIKEINNERNLSSTISGKYDLIINFLKSIFLDLEKLIKKAKKT